MCLRSRKPAHSRPTAAGLLWLVVGAGACEREERRFDPLPGAASTVSAPRQSPLQPGPPIQVASSASRLSQYSPYEENAYAVAQGKTLFSQFNCSGCHAQGGGGMGPPLMDAEWLYGSSPENVFETIAGGRPNGMPAFGGKIIEDQIWRLVAYVRSMSGMLREDVAPGRSDAMQVRSPEQATDNAPPEEPAGPGPGEGR